MRSSYIYFKSPISDHQSRAASPTMLLKNNINFLSFLFPGHCCMVTPKKTSELSVVPEQTLSNSQELERIFNYFDEDGDGKISPAELQNCMRASGEDLSEEDTEDVVRYSDSDGDGMLSQDDFARLVGGDDEEERGRSLQAAFRAYEMEGWGCITAKSLKRALGRLGESKSLAECREMIRRFDIDGDGVISFEEFRIMMML